MGVIEQDDGRGLPCNTPPRPYDLAKLAYAAGYFDGEGTINVLLWKGSPQQLRVELTSYDLDALLVFEELFGGKPRWSEFEGVKFQVCRWAKNNTEAISVLTAIAPFLRAKKDRLSWPSIRDGTRTPVEGTALPRAKNKPEPPYTLPSRPQKSDKRKINQHQCWLNERLPAAWIGDRGSHSSQRPPCVALAKWKTQFTCRVSGSGFYIECHEDRLHPFRQRLVLLFRAGRET